MAQNDAVAAPGPGDGIENARSVPTGSDRPPVAGLTYDEIWLGSWAATLQECKEKLQAVEYEYALQVQDIDNLRVELDRLRTEYSDDKQKRDISLLYPALADYDQFAVSFVKMMAEAVDVSMLWGLLYLVIKLSLESRQTTDRINRMLKQIGHRLRRLNQCATSLTSGDYVQVKLDMLEIHREMILLWLNIIMTFRTPDLGYERDTAWDSLQGVHEDAMSNIGDAVTRIEHTAELVERKARALVDMETLQSILKDRETKRPGAEPTPNYTLPVARNKGFFGRTDILKTIDEHLYPSTGPAALRSLALHGLGGVGKTQIALAYAYSKLDEIDAVFWIPAEQELSRQQGFTRVAIEGIHLEGAQKQAHQENILMVMNWLNRTDRKWLLIFDNVESHQIFSDCWPVSRKGAVLITTRSHAVASQPIDRGLEIREFSVEDGAQYLLLQLAMTVPNQEDRDAALEISKLLNGYALALSQMAAFVNSRSMKIKDFVNLYKKYPRRLHRERRPGWKYLGYDHAVDTVWDISFESIDAAALCCISVMSFLSPDGIPEHLFQVDDLTAAFKALTFCEDEMAFGDATEQITAAALIRYDRTSRKYSMHRLVQQECLFRISDTQRQEALDAAIKLLLGKFPSRGSMVTMDHLWEEGDGYLLQIASVANRWLESRQTSQPLLATTNFCVLMADAAWFVHDNDVAGIMSLVVDCAGEAHETLLEAQQDAKIHGDILQLLAIRDLVAGNFDSSYTFAKKALDARVALGTPQDLKTSNAYNYVGLALDSLERHDEAKFWFEKKEPMLNSSDDDMHIRLRCQHDLNTSRNLYSTGDYAKAEERLNSALKLATDFKSWYSLGYVHETFASLYSRSGDLEKAHKHVQLAGVVLGKDGGFTSISWISALCAYRAACVAILQNRTAEAIAEAQKAVAFGRLYKAPIGARARSAHVLAKALALDPARQDDAAKSKEEAHRLRHLLRPSDPRDDSDHAYEMLVSIVSR